MCQGIAIVKASFEQMSQLAVAVGNVHDASLLLLVTEHSYSRNILLTMLLTSLCFPVVDARINLAHLESLNHCSQSGERLVDMFGLSKPSLVGFTIKFLTACQVDEGELGNEVGLLLKLLAQLNVLLAILASSDVSEH